MAGTSCRWRPGRHRAARGAVAVIAGALSAAPPTLAYTRRYARVGCMKPSVLLAVLLAFAASAIVAYVVFTPGACGGGIPVELPVTPSTADASAP